MNFPPIIFTIGTISLFCFTMGCETSPMRPLEKHSISATVVYADTDVINVAAQARGYSGARVNGFYDPERNEIWCPNDESLEALRTCGHELRHLIKGQFH